MTRINTLPVLTGLQVIAQSLQTSQMRLDTVRFLLFQVDSIHADINDGQQLTDSVWRRNPNGTVSLDRPQSSEAEGQQTVQSQFIVPAAMPEVVKPAPRISPEAVGLINYVVDLYEKTKPKGAVLLGAGMPSAPVDWQMDVYNAVTRKKSLPISA